MNPACRRRCLLAVTCVSVTCLALFGVSKSAIAAPVNVNCTTGGKIQPVIDAAAPGSFVDIVVTGTCNENVNIYPTSVVQIESSTGAIMNQQSGGAPLVKVNGRAWLIGLKLNSSLVTNEVVQVSDLAYALIASSTVTGAQASQLIHVWDESFLEVGNSTISGGTDAAIGVSEGAALQVVGDPGLPGTPNTVVSTLGPIANVIGCEAGNVRIATNSSVGSVILQHGFQAFMLATAK